MGGGAQGEEEHGGEEVLDGLLGGGAVADAGGVDGLADPATGEVLLGLAVDEDDLKLDGGAQEAVVGLALAMVLDDGEEHDVLLTEELTEQREDRVTIPRHHLRQITEDLGELSGEREG
jgi:hypothetical protein